MMVSVATNKSILRKRLLRFFDEKSNSRNKLYQFVDELSQLVRPYMYGGVVRDIALYGVKSFSSDIDVVYVGDEGKLSSILNKYAAKRNKFGGYRLFVGGWQVDLWSASNTWAFKHGFMRYDSIESLLKTTITNWDAVLFDWQSKRVICKPEYFEDLSAGYLDLVLDKNPNELGMYVRLIRCYASKEARQFSYKVSSLLNTAFKEYSYDQLKEYEAKSYRDRYVTQRVYKMMKTNEGIRNVGLYPTVLDPVIETKSLFSL